MGKWVHKIIRGPDGGDVCVCGSTTIMKGGIPRCKVAQRHLYHGTSKNRNAAYRVFRGEICERCSFKPESAKQLDVHHKDGDHSNNDPFNLQTLCANCHRLLHDRFPKRPPKPKPFVDYSLVTGKPGEPSH